MQSHARVTEQGPYLGDGRKARLLVDLGRNAMLMPRSLRLIKMHVRILTIKLFGERAQVVNKHSGSGQLPPPTP